MIEELKERPSCGKAWYDESGTNKKHKRMNCLRIGESESITLVLNFNFIILAKELMTLRRNLVL